MKPILLECPFCPATWKMCLPDKKVGYIIPAHDKVQPDGLTLCAGSELISKLTYYD